jgi:hypothetical protein
LLKIQNLERFIDKYIPIKIQAQMSETLHGIAPKAMLDKLDMFESEKYVELNANVLDDKT